ncbi:MAG TPA: radical SAM protein [Phnomibacter sp.]|nr:radical SAM protein [Phnomibacter sp.]
MSVQVLLITPPFTQLNTPYPATAYLKGFFNTQQISSRQADLGIEVTLALFCKEGLTQLFEMAAARQAEFSENSRRIYSLRQQYIHTINDAIAFLQGKKPTMAQLIAKRGFLPEASRFAQLDDLQFSFGSMGFQDQGKHVATMYLEDLGDFIKENIDEHFGFSRYAERLGRSANSFDELYALLQAPLSHIDNITIQKLEAHIAASRPTLVALSVPFPGNLFSSFRCAQYIKQQHPQIKVVMGGGFANTELRSLKEVRVFEFYDFITLDDGERPLELLLQHLDGKIPADELKRCLLLENNAVVYKNSKACSDYKMAETGTPDYSDLLLSDYINAIEIANPMHSLWSDGRWNKLTMAHGCYWGKCTFCDISLDYIKIYEPIAAALICDRMEQMIAATGFNGFHFVDEAAPPSLMKALSLEILKRKLNVAWWTNVRFEKSFTQDLCYLLKAAGCIAVSGGLEVASDRLLKLINKGITVAQVAKVNKHFTEAGIMVHAYLMYGFPTQTAQETIDSLEMVRQLFEAGILQSAFWHQFAMTAHSPVGLQPEKFGVQSIIPFTPTFADNDVVHADPTGTEHELFSEGLKKSLHNYMHAVGFDMPLYKWFEHKVPKTSIAPDYIRTVLTDADAGAVSSNAKLIFTGPIPAIEYFVKTKKGSSWSMASLRFESNTKTIVISVPDTQGKWLHDLLQKIHIDQPKPYTLQEVKADYEAAGLEHFELFWDNKPINTLNKAGMFCV